MNRRLLSLVLAGVLLAGIGVAVLLGRGGSKPGSATGSGPLTTVHGIIGSEKAPYFADPDVQAAFARHGYRVVVDTAGSREMVTSTDLSKYDFAFPAGAPQGQAIKAAKHARATYVPFFTPMAVATFTPIVNLLTAAGVATKDASSGQVVLDVAKYLALVQQHKRWSDLQPNTAYNVNKSILITSTDVRTSNSAAMYLSLSSYAANNGNIVDSASAADGLLDKLSPLFLEQGFIASSSEEPFQDYLSIGIGKDPMVMVYEAQFRGEQIAKDPALTADRVLIYPAPTVFAKHTFVPLTDSGDQVGRLLTSDPDLRHLAVRFGFRTGDTAYEQSFAKQRSIPDLPQLIDVVDPPTFDVLEHMINAIAVKYQEAKPS